MNAVVVSGKSLDEEQVLDFVDQLEKLTGAEVSFEQQWALSSTSESVMSALRLLFSGPVPEPVQKVKKTRVSKKQAAAVNVLTTGQEPVPFVGISGYEIRVWEVHVPGVTGKTTEPVEKITITEKNLRLAGGRFATGTLLRHPRAGWSQVTGEQGSGQGMTEITAAEAIRILEG